ncbi:hypothetical protein [Cypionkella psychrotolerans]|uniref:hypothetical protein n=1 Tax=Cypionkella psychrotolerans TaxID=1678131 RepID=UPI000A974DD1|nr:hypothetical protein [Cypionkella psychrotolerans]
MKSWLILVHSVRQVFGNLEAALRVSGLLYLAQVLVQFLVLGSLLSLSEAERQAMVESGRFPWIGMFIFLLVAVVGSLWIAVGWHRYVLTEDRPGIVPPFHGDRMLGYFGKGVLIALIMIVPSMIAGAVGGALASIIMSPSKGVSFVVGTLLIYVILLPIGALALRLSTMLPGAALRAGVPVFSGWEATKGETGTFIALVVLWAVIAGLIQVIGTYVFGSFFILAFAWQVLSEWVILMVGISILTTLYGHYVEKRPLV